MLHGLGSSESRHQFLPYSHTRRLVFSIVSNAIFASHLCPSTDPVLWFYSQSISRLDLLDTSPVETGLSIPDSDSRGKTQAHMTCIPDRTAVGEGDGRGGQEGGGKRVCGQVRARAVVRGWWGGWRGGWSSCFTGKKSANMVALQRLFHSWAHVIQLFFGN